MSGDLVRGSTTGGMDRGAITRAFGLLSNLLGEKGITGEICLLGGAVMVLAFDARTSTRDVDAIFEPARVVRELAERVGLELGLPEGWLNDAAKGFVSARHEAVPGDLPQFDHLRLTAPTPEYMLAMKCMASRLAAGGEGRGDVADIAFLIRHLGLTTPEEAVVIVAKYYPEERIPARTRFVIEDLFAGRGNE